MPATIDATFAERFPTLVRALAELEPTSPAPVYLVMVRADHYLFADGEPWCVSCARWVYPGLTATETFARSSALTDAFEDAVCSVCGRTLESPG